jgi:hypothetical protein
MRRTVIEKATLVRGVAMRKPLGLALFRPEGLKFFRRSRQVPDSQPQIAGLA